jgi:hypothetical protein
VMASRRLGRHREARPAVRPSLHVRLERARRRDYGLRVGANHGHERRDDRAPLRSVDRHSARWDCFPTRRSGG